MMREKEKRQELIARLIVLMDKDWDLRSLLDQVLTETEQEEK